MGNIGKVEHNWEGEHWGARGWSMHRELGRNVQRGRKNRVALPGSTLTLYLVLP